jgi:hypothetical protein
MIMCEDGHEEIVYDAGRCPLCESIREVENLKGELADLEDELAEVQNELEGITT